MKQLIALVALAALTWGFVGCGPSAESKKDGEINAPKAPGDPPSGP